MLSHVFCVTAVIKTAKPMIPKASSLFSPALRAIPINCPQGFFTSGRTTLLVPFRPFSSESFESSPVFTFRQSVQNPSTKILTVPNVMSGIRFLLAPVVGYLTIKGLFLPSLYSLPFFLSER